jgi:hypothetical protein
MPKMKTVGELRVLSYVPLDINLPIQDAWRIVLEGNISRY